MRTTIKRKAELVTLQKPSVRFYVGEEGFKSVSKRALESTGGEILFLTNMMEWYKGFGTENIDPWLQTRIERKLFMKILGVRSARLERLHEKDQELLRETRFLRISEDFTQTIMIYGNEMCIQSSDEPMLSIVIENTAIVNSFRALFNNLWEGADVN